MIKRFFSFLKSRAFFINLGIALITLPLLVWVIFAWLSSFTRHEEFVHVPDFKNLKIRQLETFATDKNIQYEIIDSIWDPTLQKGIVIRQDPDAGDSVKEGRTVYLYVTAQNPPKMAMPDLEGSTGISLSSRQAVRICESYGLKCSLYPVPDDRKDLVVQQLYKGKHIPPGTPIEKGSLITLHVGKGKENSGEGFPIPDLVGTTFRSARGKMTDLGLEWVLIADPGTKDTLNAIVYRQDPSPGRNGKLLPGATIDLHITNDKGKLNSKDTLSD
jgi:eukaryotic-like serine/threonine-protein kinase